MFVVETAALLRHPAHARAPLLGRVTALARWCAGVRGAGRGVGRGTLVYTVGDLRLTLRARRVAWVPGRRAEYAAVGDGVGLRWALTFSDDAAPEGGGCGAVRVQLRATVTVDPGHPTAAYRAALVRRVARRAPRDLDRLVGLLDRGAGEVA